MKDLGKRALRGVIWTALDRWVGQLIALAIFLFLARVLGPGPMGSVALATVVIAFYEIFLDQGLADAIIQREDLTDEHLSTAFWMNILFALVLCAAAILTAPFAARLLKAPELTNVIRALAPLLLISAFAGVQQALLRRELAFRELAIRSLFALTVAGIVAVVMALRGMGVWSLVGLEITRRLVGTIILWGVGDWRPSFRFSGAHFRELFSFGVHVVGTNFLNFVNRRSDDLLIGYYLGPVALGFYSVGYRILRVLGNLLTGVTSQVTFSSFSRMQGQPERMRQAFYKATLYTAVVAFPMFLWVCVTAPDIVPTLFGSRWMPSVPVMQVLSFIGILQAIYYFNTSVLMANGKPSWRFALNSLNAVTNLIAFLLVVRFGIVWVAAAYVIRGYLLSPLPLLAVQKLIGIRQKVYYRQFVEPLAAALLMVTAVYGARLLIGESLPGTVRLAIYLLLGVGVYVGALALLAPDLMRDARKLARSAIPSPVAAES